MPYEDSYLWRLRQAVGSGLVLMPGAMVVPQRADGSLLFTRRVDDGSWCFPAGAAEKGGSFGRTAVQELLEETGLSVTEGDLIAFASLSEAELHTIRYPSGDLTHCLALCFLARKWDGSAHADGVETRELGFFAAKPAARANCDRARSASGVSEDGPLSGSLSVGQR